MSYFRNFLGIHLTVLLGALLLLSVPQAANAGHAAFSADQQTVYLTVFDASGTLQSVNLETSETRDLKFPELTEAPDEPEIKAISPSKNGGFWLLTAKALWHWDGGVPTVQKIADAPEGVTFEDVAGRRDGDGSVVVTGSIKDPDEQGRTGRMFFKQDAQAPLLQVFVRRLDEIDCPVYLDDGSLLFATEGDLWHGVVEFERGDQGFADRGVLSAYRYAPLAVRSTYVGTSMQTGATEIAASRDQIYVHASRMEGSGWGSLVRLQRPPRLQKHDLKMHWDLQDRMNIYVSAIRSLQILDPDCSAEPFLCESADGTLIHFRRSYGEDKAHSFLVTKDGPLEPVPQEPKR